MKGESRNKQTFDNKELRLAACYVFLMLLVCWIPPVLNSVTAVVIYAALSGMISFKFATLSDEFSTGGAIKASCAKVVESLISAKQLVEIELIKNDIRTEASEMHEAGETWTAILLMIGRHFFSIGLNLAMEGVKGAVKKLTKPGALCIE